MQVRVMDELKCFKRVSPCFNVPYCFKHFEQKATQGNFELIEQGGDHTICPNGSGLAEREDNKAFGMSGAELRATHRTRTDFGRVRRAGDSPADLPGSIRGRLAWDGDRSDS
jgi:hypothetical protein